MVRPSVTEAKVFPVQLTPKKQLCGFGGWARLCRTAAGTPKLATVGRWSEFWKKQLASRGDFWVCAGDVCFCRGLETL